MQPTIYKIEKDVKRKWIHRIHPVVRELRVREECSRATYSFLAFQKGSLRGELTPATPQMEIAEWGRGGLRTFLERLLIPVVLRRRQIDITPSSS